MTWLRVATFNVRSGVALDGRNSWPLRRSTTASTIAALSADVVGLQEVHRFQQRYLERRLPGYTFVGTGRSRRGRGERCPVLADTARATVVGHRTIWFGETPDLAGTRLPGARFPRFATTAQLEVGPDDRRVDVTSTHLDERSDDRRRTALTQLMASLDPDVPQVVLGDLNAGASDELLVRVAEAGLTVAVPDRGGATIHGFTGRTDGRRIDHILVSPTIRIVRTEVFTQRLGRRLPSDHWPVIALLDLDPPSG